MQPPNSDSEAGPAQWSDSLLPCSPPCVRGPPPEKAKDYVGPAPEASRGWGWGQGTGFKWSPQVCLLTWVTSPSPLSPSQASGRHLPLYLVRLLPVTRQQSAFPQAGAEDCYIPWIFKNTGCFFFKKKKSVPKISSQPISIFLKSC